MRKFVPLFVPLLFLACGRGDDQPASPDSLARLNDKLSAATKFAPTCDYPGVGKAIPMKAGCDDGDGMLWSGALCFSNPKKFAASCAYVRESVDDEGRAWRAPNRPRKPSDFTNSFSRDMAMGLLLYSHATKDYETLRRWATFVRDNNGKMCGINTGFEDYASDSRCDSQSAIRGLAKLVDPSLDWGNLPYLSAKAILLQINASARTAPPGYPLHLIGQQLMLLRELGEKNAPLWRDTAAILSRREPLNPLFAHLTGDNVRSVNLSLEQVPQSKPAKQNQWSFERSGAEQAWKASMIWEFVWLSDVIKQVDP
jgi:hypothetical protein